VRAWPVNGYWWSSRHPAIDAQQGVVVRQAPGFDLRFGGWVHDLQSLAPQRSGGGQVLGVVDGLVFGPHAFVVGHQVPSRHTRMRCRSALMSMRRPITQGWTE
jgi:hypothetical protein